MGPFASNCYIIGAEKTKEGMIIDPGAELEAILDVVRDLELKITMIVATHGHEDHICGMCTIKNAVNALFVVHANELLCLFKVNKQISNFFGTSLEPVPEPDKLISEGYIIKVGQFSFRVLHTPGHSPGGISLAGNGLVFSGDTLFSHGIGRSDFSGGNYDILMESIRVKLMTLSDKTVVLSGHEPETTIGVERRSNPFACNWTIQQYVHIKHIDY